MVQAKRILKTTVISVSYLQSAENSCLTFSNITMSYMVYQIVKEQLEVSSPDYRVAICRNFLINNWNQIQVNSFLP